MEYRIHLSENRELHLAGEGMVLCQMSADNVIEEVIAEVRIGDKLQGYELEKMNRELNGEISITVDD